MHRHLITLVAALTPLSARAEALPFDTVFVGESRFQAIVAKAKPHAATLQSTPIGERVVWFGQLLTGTPYKAYTLEIHDHIEAPSVNLTGLDCWTFFESALAFSRMCSLPPDQWTPQHLLRHIEIDRYWGGKCDGSYLSRLHYLEDWAADNHQRGLIADLTRKLGGTGHPNAAVEMTHNWKNYRYMASSSANRSGIAKLEERLRSRPLHMIPKSKVPVIESQLQNGDIIGIISKDGRAYGTSHVGIAIRQNGVLRFMHASSPRNHGKVLIDSRLTDYLNRYSSHAGIQVARPLK